MASEYRFDYKKAKSNRVASCIKDIPLVVAIDADVAKVFTTAEQVNNALRALISAMPKTSAEKILERRSKIKKSKKSTEEVLSEMRR